MVRILRSGQRLSRQSLSEQPDDVLWHIMTLCSTSSLKCLSATCQRHCEAAADVLLKRCLRFAILGPTPNRNAQCALGLYAQDPEGRIHGMPTYTHCANPERAAWWNKRCGAWVFGFGWQRDADQRSLGTPIWETHHQAYEGKGSASTNIALTLTPAHSPADS